MAAFPEASDRTRATCAWVAGPTASRNPTIKRWRDAVVQCRRVSGIAGLLCPRHHVFRALVSGALPRCHSLLPYRAGDAFGRALERLDLQRRRRVLIQRSRERLREELRIGEVNLHDQPLTRGVEVQPLD